VPPPGWRSLVLMGARSMLPGWPTVACVDKRMWHRSSDVSRLEGLATGYGRVVNLYDYVEGLTNQGKGPQYGATFRVVPSEMWSVQNNLTISNLDWEDFAGKADGDGVFRGFGKTKAS
jgi:hypothetical protein